MNRLNPILLIALALLLMAPAQAMVSLDAGQAAVCQVFADEGKDDGKKKEGEEEEEPDCD